MWPLLTGGSKLKTAQSGWKRFTTCTSNVNNPLKWLFYGRSERTSGRQRAGAGAVAGGG